MQADTSSESRAASKPADNGAGNPDKAAAGAHAEQKPVADSSAGPRANNTGDKPANPAGNSATDNAKGDAPKPVAVAPAAADSATAKSDI